MRQEPSQEESMCTEPTANICTSRTSPQTHGFLLMLGQINPDNPLTLSFQRGANVVVISPLKKPIKSLL